MPFVYILRCADGSLYTGSALDLERRVVAHASGKASKYTRSRRPVALAWSCRVRDWPRALRLEWRIKRLDRLEKLAIVSGSRRPPSAGPRAPARAGRPGPPRRRASPAR